MNCTGRHSRLASWEKSGRGCRYVRKKGRKTYFTPEVKVALMFLKMYTGLSSPKLMEHLNGNVHYQLFCDVIIDPMHPLTNYKLLDDVFSELARGLKIQQQQEILTRCIRMRPATRARCAILRIRSFCGKE